MNFFFSVLFALLGFLTIFVGFVALDTYRAETSWSKMAWWAAAFIVVASVLTWAFMLVAVKYAIVFMG